MKKHILALFAAASLTTTGCASLQTQASSEDTFPNGDPVTVIVPYDAGGSSDTLVRAIAPYLGEELGVEVIIENRVGAGGQLGLTDLANAAPDGHTIGLTNIPSSLAYLNPDKKATYDAEDFTPLGTVNQFRWVLAASSKSDWEDLDDLVEEAKAEPGSVSVGTDGLTGDDHMAALRFQELTGTDFKIVPYDSGSEKLTALISGQIDLSFGTVPTFHTQLETGDVQALAALQEEPIEGVDTQPAPEQGVDLSWASFNILSGPADLPEETQATLEQAIADAVDNAMSDAEFEERMAQGGFVVTHQSGEEAKATWEEYAGTWEELMPLARQQADD